MLPCFRYYLGKVTFQKLYNTYQHKPQDSLRQNWPVKLSVSPPIWLFWLRPRFSDAHSLKLSLPHAQYAHPFCFLAYQ